MNYDNLYAYDVDFIYDMADLPMGVCVLGFYYPQVVQGWFPVTED